ncbi:MAG TPA: CHAT domain-containing protein [Pyrinomonadaceae bacterium]|jgi:CHAT domain-containing protein
MARAASRPSHPGVRFIGAPLLLLLSFSLGGGQTPEDMPEVRALPLGEAVERSLQRDEYHFYKVELTAGQMLRVEAQGQKAKAGIWVVRVARERWVVTSAGGFDRETLSFISEDDGLYILLVYAQRYTTTKGRYRLTASVSQPTADDRERVRLERVLSDSVGASHRGDAEMMRATRQRLEESLGFWERVKDSDRESRTRYFIGRLDYWLGEYGDAARHLGRALLLCRAADDMSGEAWVLNQLGLVQLALGDYESAFKSLNRANRIFTQLLDAEGALASVNNLSLIYMDSGHPEWLIANFERLLPAAKEFGDGRAEAAMLVNLGRAYGTVGDWSKQREYAERALPLFRKLRDYGSEAGALNNIGSATLRLSPGYEAADYFHRALPLFIVTGDRQSEAIVLGNLMSASAALRRPRLAVFYGKVAVNRLGELRGASFALETATQRSYLKRVENIYRELTGLLVEAGRLPEALQVLNSFKDQQFFDFDPTSQKKLAPLSLTPRESLLAEQYQLGSERLGALSVHRRVQPSRPEDRWLKADAGASDEQFHDALRAASDENLRLLKEAEAEFSRPASARDVVGKVADLREMQSALKELKESTGHAAAALYTLVGEKRYHALIVTADGVASASCAIKGEELDRRAQQMWALLQRDTYDPRLVAHKLYDNVFKPVEAELPPGTDTLLWSLDGNLRYVPMAALYDGKRYLVERYQNVVFTRADRERMTRPVSDRWTGVGLGSSEAHEVSLPGETIRFTPLPGVETELAAIFRTAETPGGLLDGEMQLNGSFNRASMIAALRRRHPLVHIASHFSFRPGDEARSFLLLGDGTALTLSEMKREDGLFAGAELLTLSACNTAAQQVGANGREIDGFAEMAQRLGAAAVIATLWGVADNSTPALMTDFYRRRQDAARPTKAAALRQAQLALLKGESAARPMPAGAGGAGRSSVVMVRRGGDAQKQGETRAEVVYVAEEDAPLFRRDDQKPFAHPYYWAPFILVGNWR